MCVRFLAALDGTWEGVATVMAAILYCEYLVAKVAGAHAWHGISTCTALVYVTVVIVGLCVVIAATVVIAF